MFDTGLQWDGMIISSTKLLAQNLARGESCQHGRRGGQAEPADLWLNVRFFWTAGTRGASNLMLRCCPFGLGLLWFSFGRDEALGGLR